MKPTQGIALDEIIELPPGLEQVRQRKNSGKTSKNKSALKGNLVDGNNLAQVAPEKSDSKVVREDTKKPQGKEKKKGKTGVNPILKTQPQIDMQPAPNDIAEFNLDQVQYEIIDGRDQSESAPQRPKNKLLGSQRKIDEARKADSDVNQVLASVTPQRQNTKPDRLQVISNMKESSRDDVEAITLTEDKLSHTADKFTSN